MWRRHGSAARDATPYAFPKALARPAINPHRWHYRAQAANGSDFTFAGFAKALGRPHRREAPGYSPALTSFWAWAQMSYHIK